MCVAQKKINTRQPIFLPDGLAGASLFFRLQLSSSRREFGAGDLAADGAGRNLDFRVVADAFGFAQFAVGHEVKLAVIFGKPDGGVDGDATLPKGCEADIALAVNRSEEHTSELQSLRH